MNAMNMDLREVRAEDAPGIIALFERTFAEAEGAEEGAAVAALVGKLLAHKPASEVTGFVAATDEGPAAAILFSLLELDGARDARLLSPVAVRSDRQGQGVGKALIDHGLAELERAGVRFVVTYGDPAYYGRFGFEALDPERVVPPQALSQPVGWIGRGLAGEAAACFEGRCRCVLAFDDPSLW